MRWNDGRLPCQIFPSVQTRVLARAIASHGGSADDDDVIDDDVTAVTSPPPAPALLLRAASAAAKSAVGGPAPTRVDAVFGTDDEVSEATADVIVFAGGPARLPADGFAEGTLSLALSPATPSLPASLVSLPRFFDDEVPGGFSRCDGTENGFWDSTGELPAALSGSAGAF